MTKFLAVYILGSLLVFQNLYEVDGIKCKYCINASSLESCNEEKSCRSNVASCSKVTHHVDGKFLIAKDCGIVEFEEGDYCVESKITSGRNKGSRSICMCTGENCNSSFSIMKTDQRLLLSAMIGLLSYSFGWIKV